MPDWSSFFKETADNPLAVEVQQEKAAAYFAACKGMVASLEALKAFDHAAASTRPGNDGSARRSELVEAAAERVYFVLIQREAMKLSDSETFFADYEISDEIRARLGPRRRK